MKEKTPQEQEAIRQAALADPEFMAGAREGMKAYLAGDRGRPWKEVKKELGLK